MIPKIMTHPYASTSVVFLLVKRTKAVIRNNANASIIPIQTEIRGKHRTTNIQIKESPSVTANPIKRYCIALIELYLR